MTELCQGPNPDVRSPRLKVPAGATDTHVHLFGPAERYPYNPLREYTPPDATPVAARRLFETLGIGRVVVIQPSVYGTDNRCQIEQAKALGLPFRAVVVVAPETTDDELDRLHDAGARGVRFIFAHVGGLSADELEPYGARMAARGWHIQTMVRPQHLIDLESRLAKMNCPVVIDHMAMVVPEQGLDQPAFRAVLRLLERGHCWVKLSGAYRLSKQSPFYPDLVPFAQQLVSARPDRLLWGSDWPHVHLKGAMPQSTDLLDLLLEWAPDASVRQRILVDNPAALYGF